MQAALAQVNGAQLTEQSGLALQAAVSEYLQAWRGLGFQLHLCAGTPLCLDAPTSEPDLVLALASRNSIDMMPQRAGATTLPDNTLALEDLPPRADAECTGPPLPRA